MWGTASCVILDLQPQHGILGGGCSLPAGALRFGSQGKVKVRLTTLSMEGEVTRVETVAEVTRAQGGDR